MQPNTEKINESIEFLESEKKRLGAMYPSEYADSIGESRQTIHNRKKAGNYKTVNLPGRYVDFIYGETHKELPETS